jgi:VanZ family protein
MSIRSFFVYWAPVLVWMAVIFAGSSLTADSVTERTRDLSPAFISSHLRLVAAHMAEYAILAVLAYWAFKTIESLSLRALWLALIAFATLYAISDEVHQAFTPGRAPSVEDVIFDTIGGTVGVIFAEILSRTLRASRASSSR